MRKQVYKFNNIKKYILLPVIVLISTSVFVYSYLVQKPKDITTNFAALIGDVNADGKVDILDFQILSNAFGKVSGQSGFDARADLNNDSAIDILDFQMLSNNFGMTVSTTVTPTRPPATVTRAPSSTLTATRALSPTTSVTHAPTPTIPSPPAGSVDASTMDKKFMMGYQGWHQTPCDGSASPAWRHWFGGTPPNSPLIDFWPDVSEYSTADLCSTGLRFPNGQTAYLFSDFSAGVVLKHFQWMQTYGIDGAMVQRFTSELSSSAMFAERNKVLTNVKTASEQTGRVFNVMWDISGDGGSGAPVATHLINDWKYLVDTMHVTSSSRYLRQNGLPVVVIWGYGFSDRPGTPADLQNALNFFHNDPNPTYHAFVMGGVNNDWRTNSTWASTFKGTSTRKGYDAISPWMVGRINSLSGADSYRSTWAAEITYANQAPSQLFMPVIFPGFSFHNQDNSSPLNKIPRLGGNFVWRQAYNAMAAGATTLYGAMYDEVNEGTAFFKQAPTSASWPSGMTMVPLNTDGYTQIPSDWYLRVAGEITKMVRGAIPLSSTMSITPH